MIKVLFFAQLAEQAGCDSSMVEHRAGLTARALIAVLENRIDPQAIETLKHDTVMLSLNKQLANWDDVLEDGDEVGFLPPFSGG